MNPKRLATLTLFLAVVLLPLKSEALSIYLREGSIGHLVKYADIVVVGTVIKTEFVFRGNLRPTYTTDITIEPEDIIKGEPNAGKNIIFMVMGGRGINPITGKDVTLEVDSVPNFTINERVLLFLKRHKHPTQNRPYDGLGPSLSIYGKRKIEDGKVSIPYIYKANIVDEYDGIKRTKLATINRTADLSLDLVVTVAKASIIDPDAIKALEADVANAISQTPKGTAPNIEPELLKQFERTAERILRLPEEKPDEK